MRRSLRPVGLFGVCALLLACSDGGTNSEAVGSDGAGGNGSSSVLDYCDVEPILVAKCQRCHGDPTENGAPFALLSYADLQGPSNKPRFSKIQHALDTEFMPPTWLEVEPPVEPLTCDEKLTLLTWLENGDPPASGSNDCGEREPERMSCD